ncbi:MAG TPA: alpha/beta fold hydrolase [Dehalococcoidia bacterium]|nr:alpha/beta fold hydrolase [Dehalococcoidia bacterium]
MEESVSFYSQGARLFANLHLPSEGAPCVVMSHGLESSKDGAKWRALTPQLYEQGFAVFRFSYRGCGRGRHRSQGNYEDTTLTGRIADYRAALAFVEGSGIDRGRVGVVGSSFGGMVAIAANDSRIKAMVALATPLDFPRPSAEEMATVAELGYYELPSGRRLKPGFFDDLRAYDLRQKASQLCCPLLIIHGERDEVVPISHAYELNRLAGGPRRLEVIAGGSHSLNSPRHLKAIAQLIIDWFRRYL